MWVFLEEVMEEEMEVFIIVMMEVLGFFDEVWYLIFCYVNW